MSKNVAAASKRKMQCRHAQIGEIWTQKVELQAEQVGKTVFTRSTIKAGRGRQVQGGKSWLARVQKQAEVIK